MKQVFLDAVIAASGDLDENLITSLKSQGAPITSWGVGTKLITSADCPAFGGVYKLAASKPKVLMNLLLRSRFLRILQRSQILEIKRFIVSTERKMERSVVI